MDKYLKKITELLLWISAIVTLSYICMLGFYNTLSLDDYGYVYRLETQGFFESIRTVYNGWQCRFSTFFMNNIIFLIFGRASNLVGVTLIMLALGYVTFGLLFDGIIKKYSIALSNSVMFASTILLVNLGVMSYLESNTFFWLCTLNYTFSSYMAILLVYSVFYSRLTIAARWILAVFCSIYIGGTAENFTPMILLVFVIVLLCRICKNNNICFFSDNMCRMLFISSLVMLAGFVIVIIGPGNKNKFELLGADTNLTKNLFDINFLSNTIHLYIRMLKMQLSKSLFFISLVIVFFVAGLNSKTFQSSNFKIKEVVIAFITILLFIFVEVAICVYGTGGVYADLRAFSFISFVIIIPLCCLSFEFAMSLTDKNKKTINYISLTGLLCIITSYSVFFINDKPLAKQYYREITERNNLIEKEVKKGRIEPLVVEPITENWENDTYSRFRNMANWIIGSDNRYYKGHELYKPSLLDKNPNDWKNNDLKNYYNASFNIIGWCDSQ